jgi:amino acid transporter
VIFGGLALHGGAGAGGLTLAPLYDSHNFSLTLVAGATSIAVLSFLGFDGISTLAEESAGGQDSVARATIAALTLVGALFMLQTWIAADLARGMRFTSPETAFYEICERAGGEPLRLLVIIANTLASAVANAMAAQAAVARVLYAMGRDGRLPAVLARVHPRYQTPYVSTLLVAGVSIAVGLLFFRRIDDLSRIVNFGALSSFLLLHAAVINHFMIRGRSRAWGRYLVIPLAGFAVIAWVLYEMDGTAKVMGAAWLGVGLLYFALMTWVVKKPAAIEL